MSLPHQIEKLQRGEPLSAEEVGRTISQFLAGDFEDIAATSWLLAMEEKPITAPELAAAVRTVLAQANPFTLFPNGIDCCGTGGDGAHTRNVSTATAFVLAAAGVTVVKHGNRAVSSKSGSADVLQALGIALDTPVATLETAVQTLGIAFLFAPQFHPGLAKLAPLRRAIGKRTLFNVLGPLCNPARPHTQLMGVYAPHIMPLMAETLRTLGSTHALVVHSDDGLDEISISAPTRALHLHDGMLSPLTITPEDAGLPRHPADTLRGGDAAENAQALHHLLHGTHGAYRDAVLLNAAAGLWLAGRAATLRDGAAQAAHAIDSGATAKLLEDYRQIR
jgi:anthranilate phosphoribosyltransferase